MAAVTTSCDKIKNVLECWYVNTQAIVWFQVKNALTIAVTKTYSTITRSAIAKVVYWSRYMRYTQYTFGLDFLNTARPYNEITYLNEKLGSLSWHNGNNGWIGLLEIWYVCAIVDYSDNVDSPLKGGCVDCSKNTMQIVIIVSLQEQVSHYVESTWRDNVFLDRKSVV